MGTYNDSYNTIFYILKLQDPRSALLCGAICGMHVFTGFVDNLFRHFRPEICHGTLPRRSRFFFYKMLPIYSFSIDPKLSTRHAGCQVLPGEIPNSKITHQHTAAIQVHAIDTALRSMFKTWEWFYSDGKCPLDGTWCQRNNCQSS